MGFQLQELLPPKDASCGPCLDDDVELYADFNSLEQWVQGRPEQVMGESVIQAVAPSWGKAHTVSVELLRKTADLRVACYLTQALLVENQFEGLSAGLKLIQSLLDAHWEDVHPQLVIDGDKDPDYRVNAIAYLGDPAFVMSLVKVNMVFSRAVGNFSLKDYLVARGDIVSSDNEDGRSKPELPLINAAFMDAELDRLIQSRQWVSESIESIAQISSVFVDKLSSEYSPQLGQLGEELEQIAKIYDEILVQRNAITDQGSVEQDVTEEEDQMEQKLSPVKQLTGSEEISSRDDVIKQIDRICKYYERFEPSSPVPLVLNRAKKLVTMDFMGIIEDVSPDSVKHILNLAGIKK